MNLPLLQHKEDIEDICIAAVKERDIEAKLKQVEIDWRNQEFLFSHFKNRGELLLKGDRILDVVALLEDSLMLLSSLMSNRFVSVFYSRSINCFSFVKIQRSISKTNSKMGQRFNRYERNS